MDYLYLDFETYFDRNFSLKKLSTTLYVRDKRCKVHGAAIAMNNDDFKWVSEYDIPEYLRAVDRANTTLVAHNTAFDGFILGEHYDWYPNAYADTLSMARALDYFSPNDLDKLARRHKLQGKARKSALAETNGVTNLTTEQENALAEYALDDGRDMRELFKIFRPSFNDDEMELISMTLRLFCNPSLYINHEMLKAEQQRVKEYKQNLADKIGMTPKEIRSRTDFPKAFEARGKKLPYKWSPQSKTHIPATAKTDKEFIALKDDPDVGDLVKAKLAFASTQDMTRPQNFIQHSAQKHNGSNKFPVPLKYYGAHTGRFSGFDKVNVQNLKRKSVLRQAIEAPKGHVLVVNDLGQIEARVLAWLAEQTDLLDDFRHDRDPYIKFYNSANNANINKKDNPVERHIGKTCVLGLGYGMGAPKLQATLAANEQFPVHLDLPSCYALVTTYRTLNHHIPAYWAKNDEQLTMMQRHDHVHDYKALRYEHAKIRLPNGLYIRYPHLAFNEHLLNNAFWDGKTWRQLWGGTVTENVTQALARIIMTGHMLPMDKEYPVVAHTHDEIVQLAPENKADDCMNIAAKIMTTPPDWAPDLPLSVEGGYAHNYSK